MSLPEIQSEAFKQAALRSERIRIIGLLGGAVAMLTVAALRALLFGSSEEIRSLPGIIVLLVSLMAYESLVLVLVNRLVQSGRDLPSWASLLNLFIETLFPTIALLLLTQSAFWGPYRALVAPAVPVYFYLIILSTLRLNPSLSWLTGLFSAAGYLAATGYTYWKYPDPAPGLSLFPVEIYLTYAAAILIGGVIAAAVAGQIRNHVRAALREAETRREVERLEHDLGIARSIQQGLLPRNPPQLDGFEIAGWNQPADQTGGDYFDWQELPDGRVAISLADVTGHGIGPALVTAVCRAYARASFPSDSELESVMKHLNDLLFEDLPPERFVTFVGALLDPTISEIQLLSAGHAPLLLYTAADDRVHDFDAHGVPFGLFSGSAYGSPQQIKLAPGDMLILITDGFLEWMNSEDEEFGLSRAQEVLRTTKDLPADEIISKLYSAVITFSGGTEQQDDLTAVILKRNTE
jgi:serine phosphatase RsbU (regulator of sigma subunit)